MYQPDGDPPPPEFLEPIMAQVAALTAEMQAQQVWVFGNGLHPPSTATVARLVGEEVLLTDGPYLEGKEHVGGITIIDVPDLDAALEWARRVARIVPLPLEVRPFQR